MIVRRQRESEREPSKTAQLRIADGGTPLRLRCSEFAQTLLENQEKTSSEDDNNTRNTITVRFHRQHRKRASDCA